MSINLQVAIDPKRYKKLKDIKNNCGEVYITGDTARQILMNKNVGTIEGVVVEGKTYTNFGIDLKPIHNIKDFLSMQKVSINSAAINLEGKTIDPYGSLIDIESGIIRTLGNANLIFEENPIIMLGLYRLKEETGFEFSEEVTQALKINFELLSEVFGPSLKKELFKFLNLKNIEEGIMNNYSVLTQILPLDGTKNFNIKSMNHDFTLDRHLARTVSFLPPDSSDILKLAALLHDCAKPFVVSNSGFPNYLNHNKIGAQMAYLLKTKLCLTPNESTLLYNLIKYHDTPISSNQEKLTTLIKYWISQMHSSKNFEQLLYLRIADSMAHFKNDKSTSRSRNKINTAQKFLAIISESSKNV